MHRLCTKRSRVSSLVHLGIVAGVVSSGMAQAAPQCSGPERSWSDCVGSSYVPGVGAYYGTFKNGLFHGLGRFVSSSQGTIFVGYFLFGSRNGEGIEYSMGGEVRRSGSWVGTSLTSRKTLDTAIFSVDGDIWSASSARRSNNPQVGSASNRGGGEGVLSTELEAARARIRALERIADEVEALKKSNEELRRRIDELTNRPTGKSSDLVEKCLREGLKPGTVKFSSCIGN